MENDVPVFGPEFIGSKSGGLPLESEKPVLINGKVWTSVDVFYNQWIRVFGVFLIGPILIYTASFKTLPAYLRVLLLVIGIGIIINSGRNYLNTVK